MVHCVTWSADGSKLACATNGTSVFLFNADLSSVTKLDGHSDAVWDAQWNRAKPNQLLTCSDDRSLIVWDTDTGRPVNILEGHTAGIVSASFSTDGKLLASAQNDRVILWSTEDWKARDAIDCDENRWQALAWRPGTDAVAVLGDQGKAIDIWGFERQVLLQTELHKDIRYVSVKIVLVGDSGVGKTTLGWRLAHHRYKDHPSTHGQQSWTLKDFGRIRSDGAECEAILWDLAGQPDYRLVHGLFLDDADIALLMFDAAERRAPLSGVEYWVRQLPKGLDGRCKALLVGARVDRGTPSITEPELNAFCDHMKLSGGYIATSALTGQGLPDLAKRIQGQIHWDTLPATITTRVFKMAKEFILEKVPRGTRKRSSLKEDDLFISIPDLREELSKRVPGQTISDGEVVSAAQHLSKHGHVTILRAQEGQLIVLLAPEYLNNIAASMILEARSDPAESV
jgi:small GTP-binding protein